MILLLQAHSGVISINDEHKSGKLMSLDECKAIYDHMENWSKICFDYILTHPELLA
jgi:predicted NUDIX family phosphoesterase